jgi:hypothetical protein
VLPGPCLPRRCQRRWCILGRVHAGKRPGEGVFVAVDVHYLPSGAARAAAVVAANATFSCLLADRTGLVAEVPPYQSGQFYLRELPPLHAVLDGLGGVTLLIVDGYADLDPGGRPGLGAHAHPSLGYQSSVSPRQPSVRQPTPCRSCAGKAAPGRCMSPPPGCPATRPRTWSATWRAATGCPMRSAAPTPLPEAARPDHDTLSADALIAADAEVHTEGADE